MNKNLFRIVFNRCRHLLMAVAEIVSPQGKTPGSRPAGHAPGRFALRGICFAAMLALGGAAFADGIVADPAALASRQPVVGQSANGVTVVQIAAPSAAGVSHNQYQQFNVGAGGAILNNSGKAVSTQLAGFIEGNANLAAGSARIILNEVTAANPSTLNGYIEVAGQRAQVVIANPWGISCSGCGFINTSNATLTTGVPQINAQGALTGYRVNDGTVALGDVNVAGLDSFAVISRAMKLNGKLYAKQVDAVLGRNQVDAATLQATPLAADPQAGAAPAFALDVAALGGMYANAIRLVGTEKGVGVNQQGNLAADAGELKISSAGDLVLAGQQSATTRLDAHADGKLSLTGSAAAQQALALSADGTLTQSGKAWSQHDLSLSAAQIDSSGELLAGVLADGSLGTDGDIVMKGDQSAKGSGRWRAAGKIDARGGATLDLSGADLNATQGISLNADDTVNTGNATLSTFGTLQTRSDTLDNRSGHLAAGTMDLQHATIRNDGGSLSQSGGGRWALQPTTLLSNQGGIVLARNAALSVKSDHVDNSGGGQIVSGAALDVQAGQLDNDAGLIQGSSALTTHAANFANGSGRWLALGAAPATLTVDTRLNNAGTISAAGDLVVSGGAIGNDKGKIRSDGLLNLQVAALDNGSGTLHGQNLKLAVTGTAKNAGSIDSADALDLTANTLDNSGGTIQSAGDMSLNLAGIDQGGSVTAGRDLTLAFTSPLAHATGGSLKANRNLGITAQQLQNGSHLEAVNALNLQATALDNSGDLTAGDTVTSTLSDQLNNLASGGINATTLHLTAPVINNAGFISGQTVGFDGVSFTNSGDTAFIGSGDDMRFGQTDRVENLDGAEINVQGKLTVGNALAPMNLLHNRSARIAVEGDAEVNAKQVVNESNPVTVTTTQTSTSQTKTAYQFQFVCTDFESRGHDGGGCGGGYDVMSSIYVGQIHDLDESHRTFHWNSPYGDQTVSYAYRGGIGSIFCRIMTRISNSSRRGVTYSVMQDRSR
jgi:filamentous hemagglutinin